MNRHLFCIILLLTSHTVLAEKLYRWVEPDGSITFSPKPPLTGVDYKAVNAANNNAAKADLPGPDKKPSILATSEHDLDASQPKTNATKITARPAPAVARQKLSYAPNTGPERETPPTTSANAPISSQPAVPQTDMVAANNKRGQCQELKKRVMSLERRLRSTLEPVEMDNTVVAMARYQRNYDQHCVE